MVICLCYKILSMYYSLFGLEWFSLSIDDCGVLQDTFLFRLECFDAILVIKWWEELTLVSVDWARHVSARTPVNFADFKLLWRSQIITLDSKVFRALKYACLRWCLHDHIVVALSVIGFDWHLPWLLGLIIL